MQRPVSRSWSGNSVRSGSRSRSSSAHKARSKSRTKSRSRSSSKKSKPVTPSSRQEVTSSRFIPLHASPRERDPTPNSKILSFKNVPKAPMHEADPFEAIYTPSPNLEGLRKSKTRRYIAASAAKILDAPDLGNDFYYNLLSWSEPSQLAVALADTVYIWDAVSSQINEVTRLDDETEVVTAVQFVNKGVYMAIATSGSSVELWDLREEAKKLRMLQTHEKAVYAIAWSEHHPELLVTGSADSFIHIHDVRIPDHHVATLQGHDQAVCGLKWSHDGKQLASGGNDNNVFIWNFKDIAREISERPASSRVPRIGPVHQLSDSLAAVKALAWCPWQKHMLATGGGTADKHIRIYNTVTGTLVKSIDTRSQVSGLVWNPHERELLSAHGFDRYQLTLWKYPQMTKITELQGHQERILHIDIDPTGTMVCTGAADETLRFWKVFEPVKERRRRTTKDRGGKFATSALR